MKEYDELKKELVENKMWAIIKFDKRYSEIFKIHLKRDWKRSYNLFTKIID